MKIIVVIGSPKPTNSASVHLLEALLPYLGEEHTVEIVALGRNVVDETQLVRLYDAQVWLFSFPVYFDGVPGHLLHSLERIAKNFDKKPSDAMVYAMVNSGFIEGEQNAVAIDLMYNWCERCGLRWGGGLGIGAGGMLGAMKNVPTGVGPRKALGKAFDVLAKQIISGTSGETQFVSPNFPRRAYMIAAHHEFYKTLKLNGLKRRDI